MVYRTHALTLYGDPKYPADFTHFDYVNPDAPKAGQIRLAAIGTYDNLNPFILKGVAAAGSLLLYNRLCTKSKDEPFTEYGQLAQSMQMPSDRSWVIFELHPEARWHDGVPVSAADVIFSFKTLTTQGIPFFRTFYADVDTVFAIDERRVKFQFQEGTNREMPLIVGQLRILPAHYWQDRDFGATTLEPPLGSGPYKIADFEPGRSITYERVEEYWGRDIPVHKGRHNFDMIRYEYYRDRNVAIEAFKAGEYDYRSLGNSKEWATDYEGFAPIAEGRMVREAIPHQLIRGMSGFAFNTRREKFKDRRVRRALAYAYDFEWTNKQLFYGLFDRSRSYWGNAALGSAGLPVGRELEILEEYRAASPRKSSLRSTFRPPPMARARTAPTCAARKNSWPRPAGRSSTAR